MSATDLLLAGPRLPARRVDPDRGRLAAAAGRAAGWIGDRGDRRLVHLGDRGAVHAARRAGRGAPAHLLALRPTDAAGLDIELGILVDPLSVFMCLVVSGVSMLIHLYSIAYLKSDRGLRALLQLPQLLRLLDAAAGPGRQPRPADRRLGLRRLRLLRADQLLVPARDRDQGRHEGVRDQRHRRRRPRPRRPLPLPRARAPSTCSRSSRRRPGTFDDQRGR